MNLSLPRTWVVMLAAAAGIGLGAGAILVDYSTWDRDQRSVTSSGWFLTWLGLVAAQTMMWSLALYPLGKTFLDHRRAADRTTIRREVVPAAIVLVVLVAVFVTVSRLTFEFERFMPHQNLKVQTLTAFALVSALFAAMSIWLIRGRLERIAAGGAPGAEFKEYLGLRAELEKLLAYLGAVVGLAVLASAALRQVTLVYNPETDFPPEGVLMYGFVLSLLVALVYLPTYATLRLAGAKLRDAVEPPPAPTDEQLEDKLKKRQVLDELLGLKASTTATFRAGVAILTPLLGSLTTLLPKIGG